MESLVSKWSRRRMKKVRLSPFRSDGPVPESITKSKEMVNMSMTGQPVMVPFEFQRFFRLGKPVLQVKTVKVPLRHVGGRHRWQVPYDPSWFAPRLSPDGIKLSMKKSKWGKPRSMFLTYQRLDDGLFHHDPLVGFRPLSPSHAEEYRRQLIQLRRGSSVSLWFLPSLTRFPYHREKVLRTSSPRMMRGGHFPKRRLRLNDGRRWKRVPLLAQNPRWQASLSHISYDHRLRLRSLPKKSVKPQPVLRRQVESGLHFSSSLQFASKWSDSFRYHSSFDDLLTRSLRYYLSHMVTDEHDGRYFRRMMKLRSLGRFSIIHWRSKNTKRKRSRKSTGGGSNFWIRPNALHGNRLLPHRFTPPLSGRGITFSDLKMSW